LGISEALRGVPRSAEHRSPEKSSTTPQITEQAVNDSSHSQTGDFGECDDVFRISAGERGVPRSAEARSPKSRRGGYHPPVNRNFDHRSLYPPITHNNKRSEPFKVLTAFFILFSLYYSIQILAKVTLTQQELLLQLLKPQGRVLRHKL